MSLVNKVKCAGKQFLAGTALAGSLLCGTAKAQDLGQKETVKITVESKMPIRTATIPLGESVSEGWANLLDGFDPNTKAWYSTTQLIGKGSDVIGIRAGLDDYLLGRLAQVALLSYLNHGASYYFHEMAHDYEDRKVGRQKSSPPGIDFSDWSTGVPAFVQTGGYFDPVFQEKQYVRSWVNGLNQEEFQAYALYKEQARKKCLNFDDAISFLGAKTADSVYIAVANQLKGLHVNEDVDYKAIENVWLPGDDVYALPPTLRNQGLWNDIDAYLHHLHRQGVYDLYRIYLSGPPPATVPPEAWDPRREGIEMKRKQLLMQFIVADALSLRTWESVYAIANYLVIGERNIKPVAITLGRTEITPPLITHYLTPRGSFYNTNALVNIAGKHPLEINFGTDIDAVLGPGKVRHFRAGCQLDLAHEKDDGGGVHFRPFVYLNFDRHAKKYAGYSTGAELTIGARGKFELGARFEQNEHDIVENTVKGKEKGPNVSVGVKIEY